MLIYYADLIWDKELGSRLIYITYKDYRKTGLWIGMILKRGLAADQYSRSMNFILRR